MNNLIGLNIRRVVVNTYIGVVKILKLNYTNEVFDMYSVKVIRFNSALKGSLKKGEIINCFLVYKYTDELDGIKDTIVKC